MKNPSMTFLEQIKDNLEYVDYELIYQSIADLKDKSVPTALIKKDWFIDRVRINKPCEIFSNIEQVCYIHDQDVLEKHVGFGRANEPKQAVFYGSIISPQIKQPMVVAYFETSELLKELNKHENVEEVFTLSRWTILENIEVIEMIFSDEALKVNEYTRLSLEHQIKKYKHLPLADHYEHQMKFFSNEFARKDIGKEELFKYKITAAYSNYLWRNSHLKGITYPSIQSNYLGQNVALLPEIVDKYLKLECVGMFKFERINGQNMPIDCFKIATDLGDKQMNFSWQEYNSSNHLYSSVK
jgi:hypothetical protein